MMGQVIIVGLVLAVYLAILVGVVWLSIHPFRTPNYLGTAQLGAPQESIEFSVDGNTLRGWWVESPDATSVVIFAHGYMMNRSELVPEALALWSRGVSCLLFDSRAHGRSGGRRCTMGHLERHDLRAAVEYAKRRCPGCKIAVVGSSMGAAATALALGEDPLLLDAVVLDSAYSRLPSAILGWWRFLGGEPLRLFLSPTVLISWPLAGFNPFNVDVSKALENVTAPILFMHGTRDSLALPAEAESNFAAAKGPKEIVWYEGCGHSEARWLQTQKYQSALIAFFERESFLGDHSRDQQSVGRRGHSKPCKSDNS